MDMKINDVTGFANDDAFQDLGGYALVASLAGLAAFSSFKTLSGRAGTGFASIGTTINTNV